MTLVTLACSSNMSMWPTSSRATSLAPGIASASRRLCLNGVSRSAVPPMTTVVALPMALRPAVRSSVTKLG